MIASIRGGAKVGINAVTTALGRRSQARKEARR
jgi:hypothetical protein